MAWISNATKHSAAAATAIVTQTCVDGTRSEPGRTSSVNIRRIIRVRRGHRLIELLGGSPVRKRDHVRLLAEAWRLADELGWAKTYDAEYCALAAILDCRLLTLDGRLRRGADGLGFVVTPDEL